MVGGSDWHAAALGDLAERWQDLARHDVNSTAVLLPAPPRWGRTHLLNEFAALVEDDEAASIVVRVPGAGLPDGLGLQAMALRNLFREARVRPRIAELLGTDWLGGVTPLASNAAGLFASPLATLVGLLLASADVGAAGRVWDDSLAGQDGLVGRVARAVASVSVSVPVVVIIDDADRLEPDLAVALVENLVERHNGQVLVVAAVNPDGELIPALSSRARYGLTEGRVRAVDAGPSMDYQARVDLAHRLCPNLPRAATRRIGQRTQAFADVFAAASAQRLAELDAHADDAAIAATVDAVVDAQAIRAPSKLAVVLAWAGGIMHVRQAERAVEVLGDGGPADEPDVIGFEGLIRLADPASPRLAERVRALADGKRRSMAEIVLDTALEIGGDPDAGLVDKVVAWQAAHRIRADVQRRAQLVAMQGQLVRGWEELDDAAAAYQVAAAALAGLPASGSGQRPTPEQDDLSAAVLRLARSRQPQQPDPLIDATVTAVAAGGAMFGLEARIWAAIDLLGQPGERDWALELTGQITAELSQRNELGAVGNRWRLLLAFHAGRAGYPAAAQQLLAPMLNAPDAPGEEDSARAVQYAVGGPGADTRLQIAGLEAELAVLPPDADDDRLRVHHALAAGYAQLGDFRHALPHGQQELPLRRRVQGADHPDSLITRSNIAHWTGQCGDPAGALRLLRELLPDQERVLGPDHPDTLGIRSNIAYWTARCGDPAGALRLLRELVPDVERVLGPDHPVALTTRSDIAFRAGECGDQPGALRLFRQLLPDREGVLGPDHPDTLTTRSNIASWTGQCGDPAGGLRLLRELLPDQQRVLGPDHPDTVTTRGNIGHWTGRCGDPAGALQLFRQLLPDQQRVLGPGHPDTLVTRSAIASWTGQCGDPAGALRLFHELLPDQERVLGADHPDTLTTRGNIASCTWQCGDWAGASRLFRELLPDRERVLGPEHPDTVTTRRAIERLDAPEG